MARPSSLYIGGTGSEIGEEALGPTIGEPEFIVIASANISAGGQNTTSRLSSPSGGSTFGGGKIYDDENPQHTKTDLTLSQWREDAVIIQATNDASFVDYEFRITLEDGTVLTTYSVSPQVTISSGSGTDFPDTRIESVATGDSQTGTATFVVAITESVTASDSQAGTAAFVVARAESVAGSDSQSATAAFVVARSESLATSDAQTAGVIFPVTLTESISAADSQSALQVFAVVISESVTATDSQSAITAFVASLTESLVSSDVQAATAAFVVAIYESAAAADSQSVALIFLDTVTESLAVSHSQTGTGAFAGIRAETLTLSETIVGHATFLVAVDESAVTDDDYDTVIFGDVEESLVATDSADAAASYFVSVNESLAISDEVNRLTVLGMYTHTASGNIQIGTLTLILVDVTSPFASPVRVQTPAGIKAVRLP